MSPTYSELQSEPGYDRLAAVAEAVAPGSSIASVRRLEGGLGNGMHILELTNPVNQSQRIVLRRYTGDRDSPSIDALLEWRVLKLLQELGIAAPEPLFLDADGSVVGSPSIVISFVDGKPVMRTSDVPDWARQVAKSLWKLHSVDLGQVDASFLGQPMIIAETAAARCADGERFRVHPLGQRLRDAALEEITDASPVDTTIVHGDSWPGNILWRAGKLLAFVDWNEVVLSDPAIDVGYMWMDLMLIGEDEAAEEFTGQYEDLNGGPVPNLRLSKMQALSRAMPRPERWLPGWTGLGLTSLTAEEVRRNFSQMIENLTR